MKPDVAKNMSTSVSSFGVTERDALRRKREEKLRQNGQIRFLAQNKKNTNFEFHMYSKGSQHFPDDVWRPPKNNNNTPT